MARVAVFEKKLLRFEDILTESEARGELCLERNIGDDGLARVAQFIARSKALRVVRLRNIDVGPTHARAFGAALKQNACIEEFGIKFAVLRLPGVLPFAKALGVTGTLLSLSLVHCGINAEACEALASTLCVNSSLRCLEIGQNPLGNAGASAIAFAAGGHPTLRGLFVNACEIGTSGCEALAQVRTLDVLDLGHNRFGDAGASMLAQALGPPHSPSEPHGGCGPRGPRGLCNLMLVSCGIEDKGAARLAERLIEDRTVSELALCRNRIGHDGIVALASALSGGCVLRVLRLGNNPLASAMTELADALPEIKTLEELYLPDCELQPCHVKTLASRLHRSRIQVLDLSNNCVSTAGATALADAMRADATVHTLNLSLTNLGDGGAAALAGVLDSFRDLDLSMCGIGYFGVSALTSAVRKSAKIERLVLRACLGFLGRLTDANVSAMRAAMMESRARSLVPLAVVTETCLEFDVRRMQARREAHLAVLAMTQSALAQWDGDHAILARVLQMMLPIHL
jgi:Ran GTPase-activating protein (RanGAP) involved in mRNA processing and transport